MAAAALMSIIPGRFRQGVFRALDRVYDETVHTARSLRPYLQWK
jgi:hypothetical protein